GRPGLVGAEEGRGEGQGQGQRDRREAHRRQLSRLRTSAPRNRTVPGRRDICRRRRERLSHSAWTSVVGATVLATTTQDVATDGHAVGVLAHRRRDDRGATLAGG